MADAWSQYITYILILILHYEHHIIGETAEYVYNHVMMNSAACNRSTHAQSVIIKSIARVIV